MRLFSFFILLFSPVLLLSLEQLTSPQNVGYETQRQEKLIQNQAEKIQEHRATIGDIKVENNTPKEKEIDKGPSFVLQGVSIKGNTTFDQKEIIPFVKPYVGLSVYTTTLKEIAKKITNFYHEHGYITSKCILPQQKVTGGKVIFQIIEDKLGAIVLSGEHSYEYNPKLFAQYFQSMQGKIINVNELNTKLNLLKNLPISKVVPTLSRVRPGLSNLILKVTEKAQNITLTTDNYGSYYSGEYRASLSGNINNIMGISDILFLSATLGQSIQDYNSLALYYRHPIGTNGARMLWGGSMINYQLDPDKVGSDTVFYDGGSSQFNIMYEQPFFINRRTSVWLSAAFDNKHLSSRTLENKTGDTLVDSLDVTSVVTIGAKMILYDAAKGSNTFSLKFSQAIPNFLNSMTQEDIDRKTYNLTQTDDHNVSFEDIAKQSPLKYGKNLSANFNKLYLSLYRLQYLPYDFTMKFSLYGNYTSRRIVQAYEFNTGDYGYSGYVGVYRNLFKEYINMGFSYSYAKVYDYDEELDTTTRDFNSVNITLNSHYESFFLSLSYSSDLETWDSNTKNLKFNAGYTW